MSRSFVGYIIVAPDENLSEEQIDALTKKAEWAKKILPELDKRDQAFYENDEHGDFYDTLEPEEKNLLDAIEDITGHAELESAADLFTDLNVDNWVDTLAALVSGEDRESGWRIFGKHRILVCGEHTWGDSAGTAASQAAQTVYILGLEEVLKWT